MKGKLARRGLLVVGTFEKNALIQQHIALTIPVTHLAGQL